jgi:TonB family protein
MTARNATRAASVGAFAALLASAVSAAPQRPAIVEPDWVRRPGGPEIDAAYPKTAALLAISGKAAIRCSVAPSGALENCTALDESPMGLGFAKAALSLRTKFEMRPRMVDGRRATGGVVTIPISFTADQPGHEAPSPSRKEPETAVLALARQAVATSRMAEGVENMGRVSAIRETSEDEYVSAEVRDAARQAYNQAFRAILPELRDRIAPLYARTFSMDELRAIAAASRDSRLYNAQTLYERLGPALTEVTDPLEDRVTTSARDAFCRVRSCAIAPLTIPPEQDAAVMASNVQK